MHYTIGVEKVSTTARCTTVPKLTRVVLYLVVTLCTLELVVCLELRPLFTSPYP
jgi:hypothetical protein